jgi:hypothetical protein
MRRSCRAQHVAELAGSSDEHSMWHPSIVSDESDISVLTRRSSSPDARSAI